LHSSSYLWEYPLAACCQLKGRAERKFRTAFVVLGGIGGMRVYAYVDGFNLYYRAIRPANVKWINLVELVRGILDPKDRVDRVRYFTARVSARAGDPDAPRRQQIYLSALETLPPLSFHYGKFLPKIKRRPLAKNPRQFVEVLDTEEKGSDVNLAVHLLNDGWHGRYELTLVLSQDSDLIEAMRIVAKELNLLVGLVWVDGGRPNKDMAKAASFVRHLRKASLAAARFPDPVIKADGTRIAKPASW
jgi:hypothetical protein